jgi:peptidoglycan/xylan/chitin deacetylase (PgdA/CDA1 family)
MRPLLRDLAAELLALVGATSVERRLPDRLAIATFHRVLPEEQRQRYPLPGLVVTPSELGWFLSYFSQHFRCGTLRETASAWRARDKGGPRLAITFDDGQLDNFVHARPVLARHGIRASFYIPVQAIDERRPLWHDHMGFGAQRAIADHGVHQLAATLGVDAHESNAERLTSDLIRDAKHLTPIQRAERIQRLDTMTHGPQVPDWAGLMTWEHIRELAAEGHEIGSHSLTHPLLPQCSDAEITEEVAGSRRALQEKTGAAIDSLCYPNGDHDDRCVRAAEQAGYTWAVTTRWGVNSAPPDRFRLRRCDMDVGRIQSTFGSPSRALLAWRMSGLYPGLQ